MRRLCVAAGALALFLGAASLHAENLEHVVRPGETLWSIAAKGDVYDDPYLWPLIYKFNRDQIKNPSQIYPGQTLLIPIDVDERARRAAHTEAGLPLSAVVSGRADPVPGTE